MSGHSRKWNDERPQKGFITVTAWEQAASFLGPPRQVPTGALGSHITGEEVEYGHEACIAKQSWSNHVWVRLWTLGSLIAYTGHFVPAWCMGEELGFGMICLYVTLF